MFVFVFVFILRFVFCIYVYINVFVCAYVNGLLELQFKHTHVVCLLYVCLWVVNCVDSDVGVVAFGVTGSQLYLTQRWFLLVPVMPSGALIKTNSILCLTAGAGRCRCCASLCVKMCKNTHLTIITKVHSVLIMDTLSDLSTVPDTIVLVRISLKLALEY